MIPLIASIGSFLPGLFGKKLSYSVAKALGAAILVLVLLAVLSLGKCAYDASVIEQHETADRAAKAERQLQAERRADEQAEATANELIETQRQLDIATNVAARENPVEAAKEVGPVSQSYYDTLRKEKQR